MKNTVSVNFLELSPASLWVLDKFENCQNKVAISVEKLELSEVVDALYRFLWDDFASWYVEFLKTDNRDLPFARLIFGHFVILISPFAPFVAEKLWSDFFGHGEFLAGLNVLEQTKLEKLPKIAELEKILEIESKVFQKELSIEKIQISEKNENENEILENSQSQNLEIEENSSLRADIKDFEDLIIFIKEIRSTRGLFGIDPGFVLELFGNINLINYAKFLKHLAKCETKSEYELENTVENKTGKQPKNELNNLHSKALENREITQNSLNQSQNDDQNLEKQNTENQNLESQEKETNENYQKQDSAINPTKKALFKIKVGEFLGQINLGEITNPVKQIEKSQKELENLAKQIQNLENQLKNSDFIKRAEPEVILDKKANLEKRKVEIQIQKQKIEFLQKMTN